jgi:anti-sigma-K factor RskA
MSRMSLEDLERHLERLPREAWDRPAPPPAPWPAEEAAVTRRRRGLFLRPVVAAAASIALVAVGVGAGLLLSGDDGPPEGAPAAAPVTVELGPVGGRGRGASGVARLEPRPGGRATVELTGLRPSAAGDFYELWLLGDGGELVSLGSLRVPGSGRTSFEVELPVDPARFRFLDVSREPADGDPAHSTISVLRGPAT